MVANLVAKVVALGLSLPKSTFTVFEGRLSLRSRRPFRATYSFLINSFSLVTSKLTFFSISELQILQVFSRFLTSQLAFFNFQQVHNCNFQTFRVRFLIFLSFKVASQLVFFHTFGVEFLTFLPFYGIMAGNFIGIFDILVTFCNFRFVFKRS